MYGIADASSFIDEWVHIAAVFYNGSVTNGKIYVNGVEQALSVVVHSAGSASATNTFHVGSDYNNGFGGGIDDFRIYSGTLGAEEISALASGSSAVVNAPASIGLMLLGLLGSLIPRQRRHMSS